MLLMNINNTDVIIVSGATASTSIMANMVIFSDPAFIVLAIISGIIGTATSIYELRESGKLSFSIHSIFNGFKGFIIGFLSAPFMMLFLLLFGNQIALKYGFTIEEGQLFLNSLYFISSLLFSRIITKWIMGRFEND